MALTRYAALGLTTMAMTSLALSACSAIATSTTLPRSTTTTSLPVGMTSPEAVGALFVHDASMGNIAAFCAVAVPSEHAACMHFASSVGTYSRLALGKVLTLDARAIITYTGTVCSPTHRCVTNGDDSFTRSDGITFTQGFAQATAPGHSPFLGASVELKSQWYATGFTATT